MPEPDAMIAGVLRNLPARTGNISHRVALTDAAGVDDELRGWLQAAYTEAG